ncbi:MAG TPA: histidine--tRNA ligase [Terriglobales bacterium]|nr:histidine--tRNA ligase [Terriglobales bacterium]
MPPQFWETIPRGRFQITNELWVGKLDLNLAKRVIEACEPRGEWEHKAPTKLYGQLYAFAREIGATNELNWDSDRKLGTCIALSRIIHPTTVSLAYAARIMFRDDVPYEIIPASFRGHATAAYVLKASPAYLPKANERDWLTLSDLNELKNLYSVFDWPSLPSRVKRALFMHEEAAGDLWLDFRWQKLCTAIDTLVHIRDDYETLERQFVIRGRKLAEALGLSATARDLEEILNIRFSLAVGEQFPDIQGEELRLHDILAGIVRGAVKQAILDSDFSAVLRDDRLLRTRFPLAERKTGIIKAVRGTRDLLPPETDVWNHVEKTAHDVFRIYGFQEIRTPIFEDTQLFARGVGEETDIVSKEMFTWEDRARAKSEKSQSLTLRPENTAGVVRAYIEHNLGEAGRLQRFYYIGPQFRRERPQKGRYRQFYQIGAEVIGPTAAGSESPAVDAELLEMLATLLDRLGIQGWSLKLNSVGCANDRPIYLQALRDALKDVVHTMCSDCQRRAETNPLRVLDCKVPADQPIIEKLPRMADYLDESCRAHFAEVQKILTAMEVPFTIDHRLVRGLDYYTRTAFEFTHGALGAQNAILGGGRYDGLSESLGGPPAPGIGFAIGEDRLVMSVQESSGVKTQPADVYIAPLGAGMNMHAAKLARELRKQGVVVIAGDESFKLKKSLETASKLGVRFALILGENEVNSGQYALKNLSTREQVGVSKAEIAGIVHRK